MGRTTTFVKKPMYDALEQLRRVRAIETSDAATIVQSAGRRTLARGAFLRTRAAARVMAPFCRMAIVLAPQMRKLLPPRDPVRAFGVGALWGWLPCGLVYAELAVAAASGGPYAGALVMSAFGLGTIVALSVVSVLLNSLGLARMPRQAAGGLLVLFAVWTVLPLIQAASHAH